jgi:phosphatidylserine decarboxylase
VLQRFVCGGFMNRSHFRKVLLLFFACTLLISIPLTARSDNSEQVIPYKVGKWLPSDQTLESQWRADLLQKVAALPPETPLLPVIQEFKDLIENDPEVYMLFNEMFKQIPDEDKYKKDPVGNPQIKDYKQMLRVLNYTMTRAPEFNETGLVGFPINAILDWPMGTPAGCSVFLNKKVNRQLKKILNQWAVYLGSSDSCYVLSDDDKHGWFGSDAQKAMPGFAEDFICDPKKPHYGFTSWDNFFTRLFRKGRRPVASPDDGYVIANSCESAPYKIARDVKLRDEFWIKAQPYSLVHMLDSEELAKTFEGGTLYQAFLSALSYHRWHSPVNGTIVGVKIIDGSYYAEAQSMGFDPAGPNESQSYITNVASRALVLIDADNPDIGLMGVLFVGMAEVSSNEVTVYPGQHVNKGEQLGMFHFGGSTHVLLFRPGVKIKFNLHDQKPGLHSHNIKVRAEIATVKKGKDL